MHHAGLGIYVADHPQDPANLPRTMTITGTTHFQLMSYMYLPVQPHELSLEQLQIVNKVRSHLFDVGDVRRSNKGVKAIIAEAARSLAPTSVLEWGCGYEPMYDIVGTAEYWCTDVDPDVVKAAQARGLRCSRTSDVEAQPSVVDLVFSVFVLHFALTPGQIERIRELVDADGVMLANLHFISEERRVELFSAFESKGLHVVRLPDRHHFCPNHEFIVISPSTEAAERAVAAVKLAQANFDPDRVTRPCGPGVEPTS
jgi:hypothetical protein